MGQDSPSGRILHSTMAQSASSCILGSSNHVHSMNCTRLVTLKLAGVWLSEPSSQNSLLLLCSPSLSCCCAPPRYQAQTSTTPHNWLNFWTLCDMVFCYHGNELCCAGDTAWYRLTHVCGLKMPGWL
jgi:hypothetical protein